MNTEFAIKAEEELMNRQRVTDALYHAVIIELEKIGAKETDELCDAFTAFLKAAYSATK